MASDKVKDSLHSQPSELRDAAILVERFWREACQLHANRESAIPA